MKKDKDIQDELKNMGSSLAGLPQAAPFVVPDDYFERFPEDILATVTELDKEETFNAPKSMPYGGIPAGYFEQLPTAVLNLAKATDAQKPQLVEFKPAHKRIAIRPLKWAVAAALIIGIGIGSYHFISGPAETGADKMLSSVPNNELHDYLQNNYHVDVDRVINNNTLTNMQLDNKDIITYLDETGWDVVD